jgi:hypothetical protein
MQSVQLNSVPPVMVPVTVRSLEIVPDPMTWSLVVGLVVPIPMLPVNSLMEKMAFVANTPGVEVDILNLSESSLSSPMNHVGTLAAAFNWSIGSPEPVFSMARVVEADELDVMSSI